MTETVPMNPLTASGVPEAPPVRLCFDLPESVAHIVHLRRTSRCYVESMGLCKRDADDLELLLGELSSNVVRHSKAGKYHVALEMFEDRYVVIVTDWGVGFPAEDSGEAALSGTSRPDTLSSTDEVRFGGMGLILIRAIADRVDIHPSEPHGTTVRAEKSLTAASTA